MQSNHTHHFTLLEVLVAVAVLVIMMSFLFQFVISAQRVWATSTARTYMADQAAAVFQLMAEDLSQIVTVTEAEDPDAEMGWHCDPDPNDTTPDNLTQLCFFTTDRDEENGAIYGVMYYYNETDKKLFRRRTDDPTWKKVGETDEPDSAADFGFASETEDSDDYLLAENVSEFKIQAAGNTDSTELPKFLRVTMKVTVPEELANTARGDQLMDRTFSRVFFLENGK